MALLSIKFIIFLLITALLYYLCPVRFRAIVLLAASGYYYVISAGILGSLVFAGYLLMFTGASALLGRMEEECNCRKWIYRGCLALAAGGLLFFKYINPMNLESPLGMAFWMVIGIGFLTDVYWGKVKGKTGILRPMLLLSFFPLMTSGPIVRYAETAEEWTGHRFDYNRIAFGSSVFCGEHLRNW